jgi:glycerate 2-kinase
MPEQVNQTRIKNKETLIDNAETELTAKARKVLLEALEAALNAANPKVIVEEQLCLTGDILKICGKPINLAGFNHIFVVGGGKASGSMAEALEDILGSRISKGTINVPYGTIARTRRIRLHEAGHPTPDEAGVIGTKKILNLVQSADENDLVICLISGGGSSLMPSPRKGITLAEKKEVNKLLLLSGATISEVNAVRKHISDFKGGWLAKQASPATVINLILSDVVGDPIDSIASGPTVPDTTSFKGAVEILRRYDLWRTIPNSVRQLLRDGENGLIEETPKQEDPAFRRVTNHILGNNRTATAAAYRKLDSSGVNSLLLTTFLEGEARQVGKVFASFAREIEASGNPKPRPCGLVVGGETTVMVVGDGNGGRNQEIALSAAMAISGRDGVAIGSMSTDGVDGPTTAAGALADGSTLTRSLEQGLDARTALANNDSNSFFTKLGDLIVTGPTGTNVNDVSIIVVM